MIVIKQNDGTYQRHNFQPSFSLHLLFGFGLPIVVNEQGEKITDQSIELKQFLKQYGFVPVFVNQEYLDYFNKEFCPKLYQPIMNNDVSITKLAALEYSDYMQECFKKLNDEFFQEIKPYINQDSIALIADYRLLYLSQIFVNHKFTRLLLVIFYNRLFPHFDNLKLIPFYNEIINSFLHANVICFSNYNTANEFLTVMKNIYQVEYHSFKGNLAFHFYGKKIYVKLQNPSIEITAVEIKDLNLFNLIKKINKMIKKLEQWELIHMDINQELNQNLDIYLNLLKKLISFKRILLLNIYKFYQKLMKIMILMNQEIHYYIKLNKLIYFYILIKIIILSKQQKRNEFQITFQRIQKSQNIFIMQIQWQT